MHYTLSGICKRNNGNKTTIYFLQNCTIINPSQIFGKKENKMMFNSIIQYILLRSMNR